MLSPFLIVTPGHRVDARLAIAAARAGETGVLDLGYRDDPSARRAALRALVEYAPAGSHWGVRWDVLDGPAHGLSGLPELAGGATCPVLILAGLGEEARAGSAALRETLGLARRVATHVLVEVCDTTEALAAQEAGFDGLVVKGHEAGGRVGEESTFLLLQRLHGRLRIPYWVQGGIGPDTAAAALLAGAAGVVLGEQLWLAAESPLDDRERRQWVGLDGSETVCAGAGTRRFRFFSRSGAQALREFGPALAGGAEWSDWLRQQLRGVDGPGSVPCMPLGQEIAFAKGLAEQHVTVAGILGAIRQRVRADLDTARNARAFAADAPLARANGTHYPILQGPMTRVSDTPAFAAAVADNGALPFLALALMTGPEVNKLLTETARQLGSRPWGVGILGFVPAELRKAQLAEVCKVRPTHAVIAGGRPSQARQLEDHGIATYLHVPSPGLLESFLRDGARKFIFEGRECGGHVGPRCSFPLWQSVVEVLLRTDVDRPEDVHVVFAGGVHDRLSAGMVAAAAAPLTARGMKAGVLMGTAYLFTREAVEAGAILPGFQQQAVACRETVLLESGLGHATRCAPTPFADEFNRVRADMIRAGKDADAIRHELEVLNVGRLRIASKGLARPSDPHHPEAKTSLAAVPDDAQLREGLYMIGQVAGLRDEVVTMAGLHAEVADGSLAVLEAGATSPLPWEPAATPPAAKPADVAIVGMACLFPRAADLRRYWQNICTRVDAVREVPPDRWRVEDFFSEDRTARDRVYSKWGAFLEPTRFDPVKWRIPPASLRQIEPMQLLSLEVAARAMADAGYDRRAFPRDRAGVLFAVPSTHEFGSAYSFRTMMRHYLPKVEGLAPDVREQIYARLEEHLPEWTEDSFPGFLGNVVAGRIARELDFNGPNFTVDAACAASLAAVFTAVEQLRSGAADLMLVGGADGTNNPFGYMSFAKTQALSPRGRSRPFDDTGDGIALGEGVGCVVLKRLADAERDGDKIYAVVKGVGASSDGKNRSLTAPHPPGQARAVNRAYEDARVSPATVSLIEAHGTGTAVGDASELTTLTQVFAAHTTDRGRVAVGSVKSMIGHTKTLAGLAGVIKAALALRHRVLPPTIGVEKPSTRVDLAAGPLYLNTETRPWVAETGDHPRRAGVSSFGFGGTNFHVVIEEYTGNFLPDADPDWTPRPAELVVLCRATRDDLVRDLRALDQQLADAATEDLAGLAAAVFAEEDARPAGDRNCRLAIVAESVEDLRRKVTKAAGLPAGRVEANDPAGIYYSEAPPLREAEVCFLYPGQGSQAVNMLRDLVVGSRWCHDLFAAANRLLAESLPRPLSRYVYPPPAFGDADRAGQEADLKDTRVAQPALGLVEVFATDLLARYGIRPGRAAGHSYGEHVALYAAGCLSREDLLRLSAARGRACAEAARSSPGGMAAVQAGADATAAALKELAIPAHPANLNAPDQTVIAGTVEAIEAAVAQLPARGLRTRRIPVGAAFHTPLLGGAAEAMREHLAGIAFNNPAIPVYSNTTGGPHAQDPDAIRGLLARHFTEPVLFETQVRQLYADGPRLFLEVGPGKVLSDLVSRILPDQPVTALPLDAPGRDGWTQLGHVLARVAVLGLPVRLGAWFEGRGLPAGTVAEFLAREQAAGTPKPTDWLLSPNKAEPVTPLPDRLPENNGTADRAPATAAATPSAVPAPSAAHLPPVGANGSHSRTNTHRTPNRENPTIAMSTTTSDYATNGHAVNGHARPVLPAGTDLFSQVQATTRALLEAQRAQNGVLERYLEAQERLLLYCTQGAPAAAAALVPVAAQPHTPRSRLAPADTRPPAGIPATAAHPRLAARTPVPHDRPAVPPSRGVATNGTAAHRNHTAPAPVTPPGGDGPPPADQFRRDLLEVVSRRTGYPIDALDETLALEAALGIDSIKTVEIFSNLKAYHEYFRAEGQEEEELLAEFSKFKTLRDIVQFYDRRRQARGAAPVGRGADQPGTQNGNGHEAACGGVKRYTIATEPAPLQAAGAKKNSPTAAPSS